MRKDFYKHDDAYIKWDELCRIGDHVAIDKGSYSTVVMDLGDYVHLAPYTVVIGGLDSTLVMGHFSGLSAGCKVICGGDDFATGALMNPQVPIKYREPKSTTVTFEPFSCIGVGTVVMPGITLAEGSVVGSNSVVTKNTEPWTIYLGNPAKPVKIRPKEKAYKYAKELGYEF